MSALTLLFSPAWLLLQRRPQPGRSSPRCGSLVPAALGLFALGLVSAALPASAGGIWRRGEAMDPGSLDPHKASTVTEEHILDELYEGLVVYDGEGKLQPGVAQSWQSNADKTVYTFHLRADAHWSNGARLTADDFVYSFRRLMDPKTGAQYANVLFTVKNAQAVNAGKLPLEALGVRAVDPLTFEIALEHPTPYLLAQLTHFTALPVYRPAVERWGPAFARAGRIVGNGAFLLTSYTPNDRLVLEKNRFFHDAAHVALDGEIIFPLEDHSAALRRFMAGEIDSYPDVPIDQIDFVRAHLGSRFKVAPHLASYFYAFDCRQKPFDDVRIRQALAMVIDREFLTQKIWGRVMLPGYSLVPPGIASYGAPSTVAWANESPFQREDEAKALMKAAGYGPDRPLHLTFRYNQSENHKATAIAIADMWKPLGVVTDFVVTDATTHYAFMESGQPYDMLRFGWFADYPDAQNFLFLGQSDNTVLNVSHFSDPAFDALMRKAAAEPDANARRDLLHAAERLILEKQPYLVLMTYEAPDLVSPVLQGWSSNVMDTHPGRYVSIAAPHA